MGKKKSCVKMLKYLHVDWGQSAVVFLVSMVKRKNVRKNKKKSTHFLISL